MNVEELRDYCLSLKGAEECFPFNDSTLVIKVGGKMFALIPLDEIQTCINLKCDPVLAVELREEYRSVQPGFHMSKTHWNTVYISSEISEKLLKEWINHSYYEVVKKLPKAEREKYL